MAAPDMLNSSTVFGKTTAANITTVTSTILENEASSGNVFKLNTLMISNRDSSNISLVDVNVVKNGATFSLIKSVTIPVTTTLDLLSKTIYLEEGDKITMSANANNHSQAVISYEVIS